MFSINDPWGHFVTYVITIYNQTANTVVKESYIAYTMTSISGIYLLRLTYGQQILSTATVLLKTSQWMQFDMECQNLYYAGSDVYRVNIVLMATSSAAAKEAVVTEGAVTGFALVRQQALLSNSSNNASKAIAVLYSSNEAATALFYWLNLTLLKIKILTFRTDERDGMQMT
jgi:hypothetical protein